MCICVYIFSLLVDNAECDSNVARRGVAIDSACYNRELCGRFEGEIPQDRRSNQLLAGFASTFSACFLLSFGVSSVALFCFVIGTLVVHTLPSICNGPTILFPEDLRMKGFLKFEMYDSCRNLGKCGYLDFETNIY